MYDDDLRNMNPELKTMIKTKLSSVYGKTVNPSLIENMKGEIKSFDNTSRYEPMNKVIKSYALDTETIEAIDRISSDLGIKSRSETLREIVKRYDECQNQIKSISEN